jgi:hypothetical protein
VRNEAIRQVREKREGMWTRGELANEVVIRTNSIYLHTSAVREQDDRVPRLSRYSHFRFDSGAPANQNMSPQTLGDLQLRGLALAGWNGDKCFSGPCIFSRA